MLFDRISEKRELFAEIASKFGTPVYVYDLDCIFSRLRALQEGISYEPKRILFAVKANSNSAILKRMRLFFGKNYGKHLGVDAVSIGEVVLAQVADIDKGHILFTGNNMTDEEMRQAQEEGVMVNIDSLTRLRRFGAAYPGSRICIRINPDVGAGHHDHCITGGPKSKFGIWHTQLEDARKIAKICNLKIVGLHQHIGSQILDPEKFLFAMEVMLDKAEHFEGLEFIDFGGGFGVPYRPEEKPLDIKTLGEKMKERFQKFCRAYGKDLTLIIEPGRYLVAESGILLVQVTTVKKNPDGRIFVGVNSGFNHLVRPAMYGSYHEILNITNPDAEPVKADIVGNLCESGDKFAEDRLIAIPCEYDLLVIRNAGAYGFSMASNYNLRPLPPEVLLADGRMPELITKRQEVTIHRVTELDEKGRFDSRFVAVCESSYS